MTYVLVGEADHSDLPDLPLTDVEADSPATLYLAYCLGYRWLRMMGEGQVHHKQLAARLVGRRFGGYEVVRGVRLEPAPTCPKCPGCGREVDPTTCWCGELVEGHSVTAGHSPVSMGCACHVEPPRRDGRGHFAGCYSAGCGATRCREVP